MSKLKDKELDREFKERFSNEEGRLRRFGVNLALDFINTHYISKASVEERIAILEFERKELFSKINVTKKDCVFEYQFKNAGHRMRELQALLQALTQEKE